MQEITVRDLAEFCGGRLIYGDPDTPVDHISIDSRTMRGRDLFVPLAGEKVDAHRFIPSALLSGAAATLTSIHEKADAEAVQAAIDAEEQKAGHGLGSRAWIRVEDTRKALQDIGRGYRKRLQLPLVGVTGSVGKTTTRRMIAAALSAGFRTYETPKNHNSQVGVPITISDIDKKDEIGVLELGMSEPGELTVIAEMAQVDVAVITNIGVAHIEQLGSRENIFREKMTIQNGLKEGGVLLVNGDDPFLQKAKAKKGCRLLTYGMGENCDYRAVERKDEKGYPVFMAVCRDKRVPVRLSVMGDHQIQNAMAALAVADLYGVDLFAAAERLGEYSGMKGRQQLRCVRGVTVIDDTYNASPVSMKAAIDILSRMDCEGRRIAVLADMKELGEDTLRFHREVGVHLGASRVDLLITYGELAEEIEQGALEIRPGLWVKHFSAPEEKTDMERQIRDLLKTGDVILFKGSNSMRLGETADDVCQCDC